MVDALRKLTILTSILLTITLTACGLSQIPYGTWHSANPELTLVIDTEDPELVIEGFHNLFPGVYVNGDIETNIGISVQVKKRTLFILDPTLEGQRKNETASFTDAFIFYGTYRKNFGGSKLYLTLSQGSQEHTGIEQIIFEKID